MESNADFAFDVDSKTKCIYLKKKSSVVIEYMSFHVRLGEIRQMSITIIIVLSDFL